MSVNKVKVALIGVENCASSFVQGVNFYRNAKDDNLIPGLMHTNFPMFQHLMCLFHVV